MKEPEFILEYLKSKFPDHRHSSDEFVCPSLFIIDDWKKHMSINTTTGLWQCFKSGEKGNFIKLYSLIENIPYLRADARLYMKGLFHEINSVDELKYVSNSDDLDEIQSKIFDELGNFVEIPVYPDGHCNPQIRLAWLYLYDRRLIHNDLRFYLGMEDNKYKNRLIIPFIKNNKWVFFQARALGSHEKGVKYLNTSSKITGIKQSGILYPFEKTEKLVVCEGPIDAISLNMQGVTATCTMGSHISSIQAKQLFANKAQIILGYDNDEAGNRGMRKFLEMKNQLRILNSVSYCFPPKEFKDWNEAHANNIDLKTYIKDNTKYLTREELMLRNLNEH